MYFFKAPISKICILFAITGILSIQCNTKQTPIHTDPDFGTYISAFTSGVVSNQSTIKVRLAASHNLADPGKAVSQKLFDFEPNIKGETLWLDEQTVEFVPDERLPSGKLFEGAFYLSRLMEVPDKLNTLKFRFQVIRQSIEVVFEGMETQNNSGGRLQMIRGKTLTYDYAEGENVENSIHATQNGKDLPTEWQHNTNGKIHHFTIDSIQRTDQRSSVVLQWNGNLLGIEKQEDRVFEIPALGEFEVLDIAVSQEPEQSVSVYFSDPVDPGQDLEGLINFDPVTRHTMVRDGNSIRLYPSIQLAGPVKIIVSNSVRDRSGNRLDIAVEKQVVFTSIKPAVELTGNGVILPSTNGLIFPFRAVNLNAVNVKVIRVFESNVVQFLQVNQFDGNWEMKRVGRIVYKGELPLRTENPIDFNSWNTFSIDLSKLIDIEPGEIYNVQLSFNKQQSLYPCEGNDSQLEPDRPIVTDQEMASYNDPSEYWYFDYEAFNYNEKDDPCKDSYYMFHERQVEKNILASDFGIIAKGGQSNIITVAVTDLKTTDPVPGVNVEIYNFQNQPLAGAKTNQEGMLELDLKTKPFLLVAKKDKQIGYLRLDDGSALSLSMFDIGGQQIPKGIKGYIYGERGVWRPGDSLYVTFILEDKNNTLPENHPVIFELYNPRQQLFERIVHTSSLNGFYDFRTATTADAPTGNWLAKVQIGSSVFTRSLRIEAVKPNRLKVSLEFDKPVLTDSESNNGKLEVKWLHGAVADHLKADVEMSLTGGRTSFPQFEDYAFDDLLKKFETQEKMIFEGVLNENGQAVISPDIHVRENAPGMLQAHFKIRAFEKGGDFSVDRVSIPYSPYSGYVGLKIPEGKGWNGALYSDETNSISIATVNEQGQPVDRNGVIIQIYDVYWRWWWERSGEEDLARYVADQSENLLQTATIDTRNGKALFDMKLGGNHYGRKFIRIIDPVTGHSAGKTFYVTYKGWWDSAGDENPGGAEMLTFSTDKKNYRAGEPIKVNIPAGKQGRALVSIESGSRVLQTFWKVMAEGANHIELDATAEMVPNIYVHITLIQPHNNVENDLPIRLYGVQSVTIENPASRLEPVISMPDVLAPGKKFTVNVSETNGRKMVYTLAVVDEGLLDLTRFQTPDPVSHFYAKEALSIHTWDMYRYVIGAFTGEMAGLLAIGGDEFVANRAGAKANRFEPVVKFLGPFELAADEKNSHTLEMPNYVGSVRTMVVAGYESAYGATEKTTPVKKPLMALATLPRVLGPGEKVELPVTVFAMDKRIKDVSLSVQTNSILQVEGQKNKSVRFNQEGDQTVNFQLKVNDQIGLATVKVTAKSGTEQASYEIELDVRAPNPKITDVVDGVIGPGESWESEYNPIGMDGTNSGVLEVSSIPALKLRERLDFLITYPHGCIEQITSGAFPQLYLTNLTQLSDEEKIKVENNIKAAIARIKSFQISSGGLSYWPGDQNTTNDWGTSYAGHFLLEAKSKGYALPPGFLPDWIRYQKQRANIWTPDPDSRYPAYSGQLMQAYRLYTLALAQEPVMSAMNRLRTVDNLSISARWRLAAAYQLAGKKDVAENLIANQPAEVQPYNELSFTFGSDERDEAMILETLTALGRINEAKAVMDDLADNMASDRWYSTQTTAYTLLAIAKFIGTTGSDDGEFRFEYEADQKARRQVFSEAPVYQIDLFQESSNGGKVMIRNTGSQTIFLKMQLEGIPPEGDRSNAENNLDITVRYLHMDKMEIAPESLEQGTDFIAEVQITHPGIRDHYKEMALTQIFPSGWEIRNTRMDETSSVNLADIPQYQDIRDDRVLTYFDIDRGQKKIFRILLHAAYEGEYYLPTVVCEAMYDGDIHARRAGRWIKVIQPGDVDSTGGTNSGN